MTSHLKWSRGGASVRLREELMPPPLTLFDFCDAIMPRFQSGGILKKCVNSQAVYPLSEQHGLKARERRYTAHEEGKHWE